MSDYRVSYADLSGLERAIRDVNGNVKGIQGNISHLDASMQKLRTEIQGEIRAIYKKVEEIERILDDENFKAKHRHKLSLLNDVLTNKYGHYNSARRHAVGILQATDIEFIRNNAIKVAGEKLFLETPNYWLVPALLALAFWIGNQKIRSEKAVKEAIIRDDIKTSLFFALVSRRAERLAASKVWLARYFSKQSFLELSSETIVVIDALTAGVFGTESCCHSMKILQEWRDAIEHDSSLKPREISRWKTVFETKKIVLSPKQLTQYKKLQEHSPTWEILKLCLEDHHIHQRLHDTFLEIMDKQKIFQPKIKDAVDNILMSLVRDYDAEELPLRREIRQEELMVEYGSDWKRQWKAEEDVHQTTCQFGELLKNIFMNYRQISVSNSTQKVAVALAKNWIAEAHQEIISEQLARIPHKISLKIDTWQGKTINGNNEEELVKDIKSHLDHKERDELEANKMPPMMIIAAVACVAVPIWTPIKALLSGNGHPSWGFMLAGIALSAAIIIHSKRMIEQNKLQIEAAYTKKRGEHSDILKATLAEAFDYREELEQHQNTSKLFFNFISQLDEEHYLSGTHDKTRRIIMEK